MYIISPLSQCANSEKQEKFLGFISKIAPVTLAKEPKCYAYAWFRSAEDNDSVPGQWVRGFEVYHDIEANTVSHRASDEYKAFRRAVGEEALLERPSDLRFWHPTGIGFMNRGSAPHDEGEGETIDGSNSQHYIVVDELMPHPGSKSDILGLLKRIADVAEVNGEVRTFWVLDRVGTADQEAGKEGTDDGIYVIGRFTSKQSYDHYLGGLLDSLWKEIDRLCESRRNTTWIESGIGFIGR